MADIKQIEFGHRLKRIDRHHRKLAKGYVTSMNHDGLLIATPHRQGSIIPLRGLFLALVAFMLFKGFLLAQLGETAYSDRMALLQGGTTFERAGAFVMKPDPATTWIAARFSTYL